MVFDLTEVDRVTADIGGRRIDEIMFAPTSDGGASFVLLCFADRNMPAREESILGFTTDDLEALLDHVVETGGSGWIPFARCPSTGSGSPSPATTRGTCSS